MNPIIQKLLDATPEQRKQILLGLDKTDLAVVFKELELLENAPQRRWYCPRTECNGNPHAGFHWCEHPIDGKHTPFCKHARTPQRPPKDKEGDPWLTWFFSGGRGTGKTRAGAEWVLDLVWNHGYKRIALVGRTPADVRDVMIGGDSGILNCSEPHPRPLHEPSKRRLVWPNGAEAFTYSAHTPSQLRGPQHDAAWCVAEGECVVTRRGEIPIEEVVVGDVVATRDGWKQVLAATMTNPDAEVLEIHTEAGNVLRCTPNHRIWANGDWAEAQVLRSGDEVETQGGGQYVSAVLRNGQRGAVYDLTVEDSHEFFASGILVHNCDELAAWRDAPKGDVLDTSWNNLMLGLRLGENPKVLVTTTPKRVRLVRELMERRTTVVTNGSTYDNLENLAPSFRESVLTAYEGTRIGEQELKGVLLLDVEGAMWTQEMIEQGRAIWKILETV